MAFSWYKMLKEHLYNGLLTGEGDFVCGKDRIGLQGGFIISRPLTSVSDPCLTPNIKTYGYLAHKKTPTPSGPP